MTQSKLSSNEFADRVRRQQGVCKICRTEPATHVDRDHKTGVVRGILCVACNLMLWYADDSIQILSNACDYLGAVP